MLFFPMFWNVPTPKQSKQESWNFYKVFPLLVNFKYKAFNQCIFAFKVTLGIGKTMNLDKGRGAYLIPQEATKFIFCRALTGKEGTEEGGGVIERRVLFCRFNRLFNEHLGGELNDVIFTKFYYSDFIFALYQLFFLLFLNWI